MPATLSPEELLYTIKELEEKNRQLVQKNEKLAEERDCCRLLIDSASDLIHSVTPEGAFLYTNQAWRDTLGYTEEDIRHLSLMDIVDKNCKGKCTQIFNCLMKGEKIDRNTTTLIARNGDSIIVEGRCSTHFENGRPLFMTAIFRNMSDQTRNELALLQSEKRYKDLFENSSDLIQIVHPNGNFLYVNRAWRETFGYKEEEIATLSIFDLIADDCQDHCQNTFQQVINDPKLHYIDTVFTTKDGRQVFIEGNAICNFENGKPLFTQCIFRDVTEKKKMIEELIKAQKLESLGVLAGGIAHDFNNLLTAILGNISLAKMHTNPQDAIADYLYKTEKASIRAQGLTKQLLTFSKGGAPIKKVTTITELIKDSTSFVLRGSKVKCEYHLDQDLWAVEADEGQLSQVAQNLVINARQAMPDGGTITIRATNKTLTRDEFPSLPPGNYIEILFQDHGTGIPQEHLSRIFDPYFSSKSTGTGLGLAISYSIIKNHGGLITVSSEPGQDTIFSILLPAIQGHVPQPQRQDDLHKIDSRKILIMDDDQTVREIAASMLTFIGCSVEEAEDGKKAIDLYNKARQDGAPFDIVIMDLTIPGGMGGKEAIAALLAVDPKAKVIVSSGYANDPIMANHKLYGFCGVLPKPFKMDDLNRVLASVIE
ncbi:MAG: PAS domain S-box protein [Desulfocapsaceae bacterium]|jgi:PAS domain S-box-containing protein|nr:PAS domain S-box protein [Desulfocapsaceae bacterium]